MAETLAAMTWVALGAAIGGPLRFFVSGVVGRRFGETFPWGTLAVNVSGAFALGLLSKALPGLSTPGSHAWLFAATGLLGSYTTVSSFSLQTLALAREGTRRRAALNTGITVLACLAAAALGASLVGLAA